MKIPQILLPTELSDRVLAERYVRHPGPYQIGNGWQSDLDKIFPGTMKISVDPTFYGITEKGELGPSETELLIRAVRWLEPLILVEFGTAYGKSTRVMAENSPPNARVLTVDLPDEVRETIETPYSTDLLYVRMKQHTVGEKYENSKDANKICQVRADVTSPGFTKTLDDFLRGENIDLALIDAAHDYDTTKILFELALPRIRDGGVIINDDYNRLSTHVGITRFFAEKAHEDGFLFYWFNPTPYKHILKRDPRQTALLFINLPEAKNRNWRVG